MPNKFIYVLQNEEKDYSRWLNIGVRPDGEATVYLTDLCHPGRISALKSVTCELSLLQDGLQTGTVQIVTPTGYFLARREDDLVLIEFRAGDDASPTKVEVSATEVLNRLDALNAAATSA